MKFKQYFLLVAFAICFVTITHSQRQTINIKNGFGVMGGITQYNFITDNFTTKSGFGWAGGLSATVDIPHLWYTVSYGMQLSENNFEISARPFENIPENEMIGIKLMAAQLGFTYHVKIIGSYLTLDLGPQLQYNGELEFKDDNKKDYFINGYNSLKATDILDISKFNVNGMAGISAGIGSFRIKAQYIYGFLNTFNKLNDKNINVDNSSEKFKSNQSMMVFMAMFSF